MVTVPLTGRQLILSVAGHSQLASKSTISTSLNLIPALVIRIYQKGPVSTAAQAALAAFRTYTYRQENFTGMKPTRLATMMRRLAVRGVAAPSGASVSLTGVLFVTVLGTGALLFGARPRLRSSRRGKTREGSRSEICGFQNFELHMLAPSDTILPPNPARRASRTSRALRVPLPKKLRLMLLLTHPSGQDKQCVAETVQEPHESLIQRFFPPQPHTHTFSPPADRSGLV